MYNSLNTLKICIALMYLIIDTNNIAVYYLQLYIRVVYVYVYMYNIHAHKLCTRV